MNRSLTWLVTASGLGLSLLLAGCAGNNASSATPAIGNAPAPAAALETKNAKVRFSIKIPKAHGHRGARYISPATASIAFTISLHGRTALTKHVNVTPTSPGCYASLAGTVCSFAFNMKAGNGYMASMTAFDATGATGNILSTGQSLLFNVKQGKVNTVPLTLNGVPASIVVKQDGNDAIVATALDLDGNFIVGPGAPQFAASRTSGATVAAIAAPSSTSPNRIGITLISSPPAPPEVETIGVTASYPAGSANACAEPGAVCSLPAAATVAYQAVGTFFAGDYSGGAVKGFTTPFTGTNQQPAYALTMPSPYSAAVDANGDVFAMQYANGTGSLYEFVPPYTGTPVTNPITPADSTSIALNSAGTVFVGGSTNVAELTSPYTGAPTYITSGIDEAQGLAVDSSDNLYVANYTDKTLGVYLAGAYTTQKYSVSLSSAPYGVVRIGSKIYVGEATSVQIFNAPITTSAATPVATINGVSDVYSVALDAAGDLFVANYGVNTITEYPAPVTNGEAASVTISTGLDEPCGNLTVDGNGNLYSINYGSGTIVQFSPPFTNSSAPSGTSSAMSDSCYGGLAGGSAPTFTLSVP